MSNMVPCKNPSLCGVQSHRPGTQSACQAGRSPGAERGRTQKVVGTPRLASSRSSLDSRSSFSADDLQELRDRSLEVFRDRQRIIEGGERDIRRRVTADYNLGPHEELTTGWKDTYAHSGSPIPVTIRDNRSGSSHQVLIPRTRIFPDGDKKEVTTSQDVDNFVKAEQEVDQARANLIQYAETSIRDYVGESIELDDQDEIHTNGYPAFRSTSETIQAWRVRDGSPTGESFQVPREAIFPPS